METKRSRWNGSEDAAERKPRQSPEATAALLGVNALCLGLLLLLLRTATTITNSTTATTVCQPPHGSLSHAGGEAPPQS